ncbi:MAG: hydrolase Cof [Massilibacillus sp.]|jgi:Cof subfamily protein (haloacid dehalogenase superfamily)|nr:hydrolase Cof [Massilibacillus sp.]
MKIDCCVFDLDGTLLNSSKEVSSANLQALQKLKKHGVKVVLATGRNDVYVKGLAMKIGITEPIIACNGALIRSPITNEVLYHKFMPKEYVEEISSYCFSNAYDFTASVCDSMFCSANSKRVSFFHEYNMAMAPEFKIPIHMMETVEDLPLTQVLKMFIWQLSEEEVVKIKQRYNTDEKMTFISSEKGGLDIAAKEVSKGIALSVIAEKYHFALDRIAVFGDHHNDISMMNLAGYSFAMENAEPEVKQAAKYITKSNDEDGIAYAIEKYFF